MFKQDLVHSFIHSFIHSFNGFILLMLLVQVTATYVLN